MLKTLAAAAILLLATAAPALATVPNPNIPEPSLLVLMASGLAGAILFVRSRRPQ